MKAYTGTVADPMFEGVSMTLRGDTFTVPELNMRNRREVESEIAKFVGRDMTGITVESPEYKEFFDTISKVALKAMKQNYPDMTEDGFFGLVSQTQLLRIFRVAMGAETVEGIIPQAENTNHRPTQVPTGT